MSQHQVRICGVSQGSIWMRICCFCPKLLINCIAIDVLPQFKRCLQYLRESHLKITLLFLRKGIAFVQGASDTCRCLRPVGSGQPIYFSYFSLIVNAPDCFILLVCSCYLFPVFYLFLCRAPRVATRMKCAIQIKLPRPQRLSFLFVCTQSDCFISLEADVSLFVCLIYLSKITEERLWKANWTWSIWTRRACRYFSATMMCSSILSCIQNNVHQQFFNNKLQHEYMMVVFF